MSQLAEKYPGLIIIGSGGNINKLFRLADLPVKSKITFPVEKLRQLNDTLKKYSVEERSLQYKLRTDRADVITYAGDIFLMIAECTRTENILVPTIGLVDGIIDSLYIKNHPKKSQTGSPDE